MTENGTPRKGVPFLYCLNCDQESPTPGPNCEFCDAYLGYVAEGRGYLPQLEAIIQGLQQNQLSEQEAETRRDRLISCLEILLLNLDETGQALTSLDLDDAQMATLAGFLAPLRQAWVDQLELLNQLDFQDVPVDFIEDFQAVQIETFRASEGLNYLTQSIFSQGESHGINSAEVEAEIISSSNLEDG
jgi:hypothetical protein